MWGADLLHKGDSDSDMNMTAPIGHKVNVVSCPEIDRVPGNREMSRPAAGSLVWLVLLHPLVVTSHCPLLALVAAAKSRLYKHINICEICRAGPLLLPPLVVPQLAGVWRVIKPAPAAIVDLINNEYL